MLVQVNLRSDATLNRDVLGKVTIGSAGLHLLEGTFPPFQRFFFDSETGLVSTTTRPGIPLFGFKVKIKNPQLLG